MTGPSFDRRGSGGDLLAGGAGFGPGDKRAVRSRLIDSNNLDRAPHDSRATAANTIPETAPNGPTATGPSPPTQREVVQRAFTTEGERSAANSRNADPRSSASKPLGVARMTVLRHSTANSGEGDSAGRKPSYAPPIRRRRRCAGSDNRTKRPEDSNNACHVERADVSNGLRPNWNGLSHHFERYAQYWGASSSALGHAHDVRGGVRNWAPAITPRRRRLQ